MTISSDVRKAGPFDGNDAATTFSYAFVVFSTDELLVIHTDSAGVESALTPGSDYTATMNPDQNSSPGGEVTLPAPLPTDEKITITSAVAYLQTLDLTNQGGFYPGVIERALDRIVVLCQQNAEQLSRSIKIGISDDTPADEYRDSLIQAARDAVAAASAAATSESNAHDSEVAAALSESHAATSETNAATSASQALASKNAAATSETNAASSASTAGNAAGASISARDTAVAAASAASTSETNAAHSAELAEAAVDQITGNGIWVGSAVWWSGTRTSIPAGLIPADGQEAPHATYPDLHTAISSGVFKTVDESDWQTDPLKRGAFVVESSTGNLRVPDLNGKSAGSIGALYATGDGANSPGAAGAVLQDAIENITGMFNAASVSGVMLGSALKSGAFKQGTARASTPQTTSGASYDVGFDASLVARTDTYTRPNSVSGVWCIQAFGTVVNPGSVDAAQLASDLAALDAAFQALNATVESGNVGLGAGQTWQNVTALRTLNTTYTNTTGRTIVAAINGAGTNMIYVDGFVVANCSNAATDAVVPKDSTYKYTASGTWSVYELR